MISTEDDVKKEDVNIQNALHEIISVVSELPTLFLLDRSACSFGLPPPLFSLFLLMQFPAFPPASFLLPSLFPCLPLHHPSNHNIRRGDTAIYPNTACQIKRCQEKQMKVSCTRTVWSMDVDRCMVQYLISPSSHHVI